LKIEPLIEFAEPRVDAGAHDLQTLRDTVERLQRAQRLQHALYSIADLASAGLDIEQTLTRLHGIVGSLIAAENFFVARFDAERDTITFLYFADVHTRPPALGVPVPMAAIEHGLTWHVIRHRQALRGSIDAIRRQVPGLRSIGVDAADWLGVPMLDGSRVCGALAVQSYERSGLYDEASQALLSFVARHVLTALERWRAHDALESAVAQRTAELARTNRELRDEVAARERGERLQAALYRIAELSSSGGSAEDFHQAVHRVVGGLLNAANYFVVLPSDDGRELFVPYHIDERDPTVHRRPAGRGLTEYVWRTGAPLLTDPAGVAALEASGEVQVWGAPPLSWLGVPLRCEGRTLGVLAVQSYSPQVTYSERDRDLLVFVSHQIASSLQRRRSMDELQLANADLEQRVVARTQELREQIRVRERVEQRLQHEVVHDALTDLPNRKYLGDRLERLFAAFRRDPSRAFAVMFMDIDRFKVINDSMGHQTGDAVLREIARRLQATLREPDVVARLGGDEFAVLVEDARNPDQVAHIAQRLLHALEPPIRVAERTLVASASIGVAISDAREPSAEALLRCADAAMYRAKANGRHRFEFYDEQLHRSAMQAFELEAELRDGLQQRRFVPHFQPLVSLVDGQTVGCEVLMRWRHPTRGLLAPAQFLAAAEDNGIIEDIDWQIYEAACRIAASQPAFRGLLGLNVSPRHLRHASFGTRLLGLLRDCGLPPQRVCLEITERALIEDPRALAPRLAAMREAGLHFALDDFGTGYSSLSHLYQLPLTSLKVDRSFVRGLDPQQPAAASRAVVGAVVSMARSLGLAVVAEGVETPGQRDALVELGCTLAQGYLFARPRETLLP